MLHLYTCDISSDRKLYRYCMNHLLWCSGIRYISSKDFNGDVDTFCQKAPFKFIFYLWEYLSERCFLGKYCDIFQVSHFLSIWLPHGIGGVVLYDCPPYEHQTAPLLNIDESERF